MIDRTDTVHRAPSSKRIPGIIPVLILALATGLLTGAARAETPPPADEGTMVESRIHSVGLFKNGLAVVRRVLDVPKAGTYCVEDLPRPVHGTFWVESDARVITRIVQRETTGPLSGTSPGVLRRAFAGREVVIHFRDGSIPPVTGRMAPVPEARHEGADFIPPTSAAYPSPYGRNDWGTYSNAASAPAPSFLEVIEEGGRILVDPSMVAYLRVTDGEQALRRMKPVLCFEATDVPDGGAKISVTYLARGLSWAPSYRLDLTGPDRLRIAQKAVIRNELADLEDAEVRLISGYPSVKLAGTTSPLAADTSWAAFFSELNRRGDQANPFLNNIVSQNIAFSFNQGQNTPDFDAGPMEEGESVDLHYQPAGNLDLRRGETLALPVASAGADYDRVVEWIVPDTRNTQGVRVSDYEFNRNPDKYKDSAWDAIRFANPFDFPITTAPAQVVEGGRFQGQRALFWVNPGERTTLHVNKALSVRTLCVEIEEPKKRQVVYVAGNDYQNVPVKGTLKIRNFRGQAIRLVIRRHFSGELVVAEREPKLRLLEEGVYSVNRRNELTWELEVAAGESLEIDYQFTVLVNV